MNRRMLAAALIGTLTLSGCSLWTAITGPDRPELRGFDVNIADIAPRRLTVVDTGHDDRLLPIHEATSSAPWIATIEAGPALRCLSKGSATIAAKTDAGITKRLVRCNVKSCLVLSVGGFGALSQVGAVTELQARGMRFDCAYGNSMGSVVASMYAGHPVRSVQRSFEALLQTYVTLTRREAAEELSGLGVLKYAARRIIDKVRGKRTFIVPLLSNARLQRAVDNELGARTFKQLPVRFATSHKRVDDNGPRLVVQSSGNVAQAVAASANHPLLGGTLTIKRVDPGIDALEAVPIASACRFAGPAALFVLNASGAPSVVPRGLPCAIAEIVLPAAANKAALTDPTVRKRAYAAGRARVESTFGPRKESSTAATHKKRKGDRS